MKLKLPGFGSGGKAAAGDDNASKGSQGSKSGKKKKSKDPKDKKRKLKTDAVEVDVKPDSGNVVVVVVDTTTTTTTKPFDEKAETEKVVEAPAVKEKKKKSKKADVVADMTTVDAAAAEQMAEPSKSGKTRKSSSNHEPSSSSSKPKKHSKSKSKDKEVEATESTEAPGKPLKRKKSKAPVAISEEEKTVKTDNKQKDKHVHMAEPLVTDGAAAKEALPESKGLKKKKSKVKHPEMEKEEGEAVALKKKKSIVKPAASMDDAADTSAAVDEKTVEAKKSNKKSSSKHHKEEETKEDLDDGAKADATEPGNKKTKKTSSSHDKKSKTKKKSKKDDSIGATSEHTAGTMDSVVTNYNDKVEAPPEEAKEETGATELQSAMPPPEVAPEPEKTPEDVTIESTPPEVTAEEIGVAAPKATELIDTPVDASDTRAGSPEAEENSSGVAVVEVPTTTEDKTEDEPTPNVNASGSEDLKGESDPVESLAVEKHVHIEEDPPVVPEVASEETEPAVVMEERRAAEEVALEEPKAEFTDETSEAPATDTSLPESSGQEPSSAVDENLPSSEKEEKDNAKAYEPATPEAEPVESLPEESNEATADKPSSTVSSTAEPIDPKVPDDKTVTSVAKTEASVPVAEEANETESPVPVAEEANEDSVIGEKVGSSLPESSEGATETFEATTETTASESTPEQEYVDAAKQVNATPAPVEGKEAASNSKNDEASDLKSEDQSTREVDPKEQPVEESAATPNDLTAAVDDGILESQPETAEGSPSDELAVSAVTDIDTGELDRDEMLAAMAAAPQIRAVKIADSDEEPSLTIQAEEVNEQVNVDVLEMHEIMQTRSRPSSPKRKTSQSDARLQEELAEIEGRPVETPRTDESAPQPEHVQEQTETAETTIVTSKTDESVLVSSTEETVMVTCESTTTANDSMVKTTESTVLVTARSTATVDSAAAEEIESLKQQLLVASQEKTELEEKLAQREDELKASKDQVHSLESEMQKQVTEWSRMEANLEQADGQIKELMVEAQEVEGLKAKIVEYEALQAELEEVRKALADATEPDSTKSVAPNEQMSAQEINEGKAELEKKLSEKDDLIVMLQKELDLHKQGGVGGKQVNAEGGDFSSLNSQLVKFSEEIEAARKELEDGRRKINEP